MYVFYCVPMLETYMFTSTLGNVYSQAIPEAQFLEKLVYCQFYWPNAEYSELYVTVQRVYQILVSVVYLHLCHGSGRVSGTSCPCYNKLCPFPYKLCQEDFIYWASCLNFLICKMERVSYLPTLQRCQEDLCLYAALKHWQSQHEAQEGRENCDIVHCE